MLYLWKIFPKKILLKIKIIQKLEIIQIITRVSDLAEKKEEYKTFSASIKKKIVKTHKKGNETVETISYKIKFIDSVTFMAISLSNIINYLTEETCKIKCKECDCFLQHQSIKNNLIKYKCLSCNKNYSSKYDEELKKKFI